jgi:hypothetical protein
VNLCDARAVAELLENARKQGPASFLEAFRQIGREGQKHAKK